jgi:hypothetical protein
MVGAVIGKHGARRGLQALGAAALCLAGVAGAASAAKLKIAITPTKLHATQIHTKDDYSITVSGSFRKTELTGRSAFLISVLQFSPKPCQVSAQAENAAIVKGDIQGQFYFAPKHKPQNVGIFVKKSPFTRTDLFVAGQASMRRVCAYLYPTFIKATATTKPIARASAKYRVLK